MIFNGHFNKIVQFKDIETFLFNNDLLIPKNLKGKPNAKKPNHNGLVSLKNILVSNCLNRILYTLTYM